MPQPIAITEFLRFRRRAKKCKPSKPLANSGRAPGIGTGEMLALIVELELPAPTAVTMYSSVNDQGPAPTLARKLARTNPPAVNVFELSGVVNANKPFPASTNVFSVSVQPEVIKFSVKLLKKLIAPVGEVLPCVVTKIFRVPVPVVDVLIVLLRRTALPTNGGLPVPSTETELNVP